MRLTFLFFYVLFFTTVSGQNSPLRLGVISLTHTHVHGVFNSEKREDFEIVGIVEPDKELAQRYADQYGFSLSKVYNTMDEMIEAHQPEAVSAFGTIYEHLSVVETCAPRGIHVMVEKPLAVSLEHAKKMEALAQKHKIHLITNYETTWYPTNHKANELLKEGAIGELRKVVVRDGHKGPVRINISHEFLDWLIDPVQNGGGAITDFGCYGANLLTWMMDGEKPISVTAVTQQLQPENNPQVDDDATILLTYKNANAVIQPSWDWPIGRKDMEIYGTDGAIYADNGHQLRVRQSTGYDSYEEEQMVLNERPYPYDDAFSLLAAVVRGTIELEPTALSALENNMTVMEILDAARKSAKKGRTIWLK
ncbi:Gfo/Idh/MocA family protein [Jiulongibacter sediminis]|uniref:Oxidoreductase n=1 Tax=Jiulongibacter sediminis TaxID=1605367 RepID=A0A0P7BRE2_9BACT|nr:Gfo/Idh/MocA family oxidoreductase [Jiulongibacter sediminis]KPM47631.1 oxidoreductase [Jiulongibacter sediminis]TBX23424.1 oxidoreductase [Jiulongibacter sediminis]